MSKTSDAIEQLNHTQKNAMKNLCNGKLKPQKGGWFHTGAKCRVDTARVLMENSLVEVGEEGGQCFVKATGLGRRVGKALMAYLMMARKDGV